MCMRELAGGLPLELLKGIGQLEIGPRASA